MTELERALQDELEKEKQFSRQLAEAIDNIERNCSKKLQEIANSYIQKLKELCQDEQSEEEQENTLVEQLKNLETRLSALESISKNNFAQLYENQGILQEQLRNS